MLLATLQYTKFVVGIRGLIVCSVTLSNTCAFDKFNAAFTISPRFNPYDDVPLIITFVGFNVFSSFTNSA